MKKILVVGAGALGNSVIAVLAEMADVLLVDGDKVEQKNLSRQPLFGVDDIGKWKVEVINQQYPSVRIKAVFVDGNNVGELIKEADLFVDLADDLHLTELLDEQAALSSKPLLVAAVHRNQGQVYMLHRDKIEGVTWPTFAEVFDGRIGQEQDNCEMQNVPMHVIDSVGGKVIERVREFLGEQHHVPVMELFDGDEWLTLKISRRPS